MKGLLEGLAGLSLVASMPLGLYIWFCWMPSGGSFFAFVVWVVFLGPLAGVVSYLPGALFAGLASVFE